MAGPWQLFSSAARLVALDQLQAFGHDGHGLIVAFLGMESDQLMGYVSPGFEWLPGLVNVNKKRTGKTTMLSSWVNPLFRLGHFQ